MATFDSFPFIIAWELTMRCNLTCIHCASGCKKTTNKRELSREQAIAICHQFPDLLVREVNITGGEPLVREDIYDILDCLKSLGIKTKIISNGLMIDNNTALRLSECNVAGIGLSVDGDQQIHDRIRCKQGLFDTVLRGCPEFCVNGIPSRLRHPVFKLDSKPV